MAIKGLNEYGFFASPEAARNAIPDFVTYAKSSGFEYPEFSIYRLPRGRGFILHLDELPHPKTWVRIARTKINPRHRAPKARRVMHPSEASGAALAAHARGVGRPLSGIKKNKARKNPVKRMARRARPKAKRIALQVKIFTIGSPWATLKTYADTDAGLNAAIAHGKKIRKESATIHIRAVRI